MKISSMKHLLRMNKDEENFNLKTLSSKKEKVKTESKNVKTKVSFAAAALPGEKKFEKMRDKDKDVKAKDSKTIYNTDTKTKSSSSSSKKNKNKIKKKSESVVFDESDVIVGMHNESLKSQTQRIELASSFLIETHSIIVDEDELGMKYFSYPGIVFIRNIKHDNDHVNCFEFNIPMTIPSKSFIFKFNPYLAEMTFEDVRLRIIYLMTEKGLSICEIAEIMKFASHVFDVIRNNICRGKYKYKAIEIMTDNDTAIGG